MYSRIRIMYFKSKMKLKPVHIVDMNKTILEPEMENKKKIYNID